ncbi:MAG: PGF-CTERM sorting domain-containing protein, partial [Euryarchaeota archaeon]|nr:PGF-CTERM sorting domain-containing protein [Euryarchaeota archaeon]
PENSFIPKLWAYTKIRRLMDRMTIEGETDALVSEITALSLEFGFVTPYTSLFVEVPAIDRSETTTTASGVEGGAEGVYAESDKSVVPEVAPASEPVPAVPPMEASTPIFTPVEEGGAGGAIEAPREAEGVAEEVETESIPTKKKVPGFGAVVAITGLAAVAYLLRRR